MKVVVTTSVEVRGGPVVSVASTADPDSYAFAAVDLDANQTKSVALLPQEGTPALLAVRVRDSAGEAAEVTMKLRNDAGEGAELTVSGHLLVANADALEALVTGGGPRSAAVTNAGDQPVSVEVLACLDQTSQ
ncbi:hypothetical protein GCM10009678_72210 [Actinomadura kijaniata]|uniref:Uncharacterized protein n=1 Tax=Actinomadura namibiensis TaxID=182080 RepID=A0A7W3LYL5_ACTNM|nr:hypothetical protein [Actinomadura namibiensis]MBA8956595.1 hypothetical protein [Actinomadura namibiensis]